MKRYVCAVVHVLTFHVDTCVHKAKHIDRGTDAGCNPGAASEKYIVPSPPSLSVGCTWRIRGLSKLGYKYLNWGYK